METHTEDRPFGRPCGSWNFIIRHRISEPECAKDLQNVTSLFCRKEN